MFEKFFFLGVATVLIAGCSVPKQEVLSDPIKGQSMKIMVLGDTQQHTIEGLPHTLLTGAIDEIIPVTIRPPQHALFGRKLLEVVASDGVADGKPQPVLHMGDALDHSCEAELSHFKAVVAGLNNPFILTPGNHDGLFQGIFNPASTKDAALVDQRSWDFVCRTPDKAGKISTFDGVEHFPPAADDPWSPRSNLLTKDRLLDSYVRMQVAKGLVGEKNCNRKDLSVCHESPTGLIAGIYGNIEPRKPECDPAKGCKRYSESFLTQVLNVSAPEDAVKFKVILMDTTQVDFDFAVYNVTANLDRDPGSHGKMLRDQLDLVADLVAEARKRGEVVVLAAHHDWARLEQETSVRLSNIFASMNHGAVYLSAHTHDGYWAAHPLGVESTAGKLVEFNISSLADWPLDARQLQFRLATDGTTVEVSAGSVVAQAANAQTDADLLKGWMAKTCEHPDAQAMLADPTYRQFQIDQRNLVQVHNENRGDVWTEQYKTLATLIGKNEFRQYYAYTDNFNDNRNAIALFNLMIKASPVFGEWVEPQAVSVPAACTQTTLTQRLQCTLDATNEAYKASQPKKSLMANAPAEIPEGKVRQSYEMLARTVVDLQAIIDNTRMQTAPGFVRLMACAQVLGAEADSHYAHSGKARIGSKFFQKAALARKSVPASSSTSMR